MIRRLTTAVQRPSVRMTLALLAVVGVVLGLVVAASAGAPGVPAPTITSKPPGRTNATSATFAFSGASGLTFQCAMDGAAFATCTSPKAYSGLANGSHTFQVRARRSTGETSSATSYAWVVDRTPPPAPAITSRPPSLDDDAHARFTFADGESNVSFLCRIDGNADYGCSSPESYRLADGAHTFAVAARDAAGNTSAFTSSTWRIDTEPPPTPVLTATPDPSTTATSVSFAFTDGEAGVRFECSLDDNDWRTCTSPKGYSGLDTGRHRFDVRALDAVGNHSRPATYAWTITKATNRDFTITGGASGLLYPGATARPIALTLTNPNSVAIFVTSVQVAVTGSTSPGCAPANNLALTQSSASSAAPVKVPAGGSVTLPAQGASAPTIRMVNLATNQDACKNARFSLTYSGSAHS